MGGLIRARDLSTATMSARLPSREPVRPSSPQRTENRKGSRIGAQRWLGARPSRDDSDSSSSSFSEKDEVPEMDDSEGDSGRNLKQRSGSTEQRV